MMKIALTQDKFAIVSDCDFERLNKSKWFAYFHHGTWYAARCTYDKGLGDIPSKRIKIVRMHREILGLVRGDGKQCDHVDGDGLNNQRENLRVATHTENIRNSKPKNGRRFKGVFKYNGRKKLVRPFQARISVGGRGDKRDYNLGWFETAEEAAKAYDSAAKKIHGEFAKPNLQP